MNTIKKLFLLILVAFGTTYTAQKPVDNKKFNQQTQQKLQELPPELQGHITGFLAQSKAKTKADFLNWITQQTLATKDSSKVALSGDGNTLVILEWHKLTLWQKEKAEVGPQAEHNKPWQLKYTIEDENLSEYYVKDIVLSFDGRVLLYAARDKAYVYEQVGAAYTLKQTIEHAKNISTIALSKDGSTAVTGSDDERTRVYKKDRSGQWQIQIFQGNPEIAHTLWDAPIASVAVNYNGTILASGAGDTLIWWLNKQKIWDRDRIKESVRKLMLNKQGNIATLVGWDTIEFWQQPQPFAHWLQLQKIENFPSFNFIQMSEDARTIAYIADDNKKQINMYQMATPNKWIVAQPIKVDSNIERVAMSVNGKTIITTSEQTNDIPQSVISSATAWYSIDWSKVKYFGLNAATIWQNNNNQWKKVNEFDFKSDSIKGIALNDAGTVAAVATGRKNVVILKQVSQKLVDALSPEQIIFLQDLYTIKQKAIGVPQITLDKEQHELFDTLPAEFKATIEQNYKIQ